MSKTVNEIVKDKIVGHSVDLNRLELQMKKDIVKELKILEANLVKQLEKSKILNGKPMTVFRQKRLTTLIKQTHETIKTAYLDLSNSFSKDLIEVAAISEAQTISAINKGVKVELLSVGMSKQMLKGIVSNSMIEGAPSKEWWNRRSVALSNRFSDTVRQGMLVGDTTPKIVQSLRGTKALRYKDSVLSGNYRSAEALVRTSVQSVANQARLDTYKENEDIMKGVEWSATFDSQTSETCMALDGLQWDLNYEPIGHGTSFPGSSAHWNCRSTTVGITKSWKELGAKGKFKEIPESTRASMDGQVSGKLNYEGWLKGRSEAEQIKVLGVAKHKMWKDGKLGFTDMVNGSGNPLTVDQLKNKLKI